jgi:hypothetical protein
MRRVMSWHDCPRAHRIAATDRPASEEPRMSGGTTNTREVADGIGFGVLNLMSNNPDMRWNIETTKRTIDHAPGDRATPVLTETIVHDERSAHYMRRMAERLDAIAMEQSR